MIINSDPELLEFLDKDVQKAVQFKQYHTINDQVVLYSINAWSCCSCAYHMNMHAYWTAAQSV